MLSLVLGSVSMRPYVFMGLLTCAVIAVREIGGVRTLGWFLGAYLVAFASEYLSVRYGFPYGWYYYVKRPTQDLELWVTDVPLFDSLSYVFLSYSSFSAARWITGESVFRGREKDGSGRGGWFFWRTWLVGALLMVTIDIIVDPIAVQGHRHFLGAMFGYPEWGPYFGVTLENFLGWAIVGLSIHGLMQILERAVYRPLGLAAARQEIFGLCLYVCTILGNIGIAIYLREWDLVFCDFLVAVPLFALLSTAVCRRRNCSRFPSSSDSAASTANAM